MTDYHILAEALTPLIRRLSWQENLSAAEVEEAFDLLFAHDYEGFYWLALTLALQTKTPTAEELLGICLSIQKLFGSRVDIQDAIDLSGTGGRSIPTFNVGTTAAFVVAGAGVKVAKQGSTAVTGLTGSVDVLQQFDVDIRHRDEPDKIKFLLENIGISTAQNFLNGGRNNSRPQFLAKMKSVGLTFVSPFHFVGGIPSPVDLKYRLFGCFSSEYQDLIADLLIKMGYWRGFVVTGQDGLDEISITGPTDILEFSRNKKKKYSITPDELGLYRSSLEDLRSTSAEGNVIDFVRIIYAKERGPKRDIVLANSAACLFIVGKAPSLYDGVQMAAGVIDAGLAREKLEQLIALSGDSSALRKWERKAGVA